MACNLRNYKVLKKFALYVGEFHKCSSFAYEEAHLTQSKLHNVLSTGSDKITRFN